jgi:hypothetical protein
MKWVTYMRSNDYFIQYVSRIHPYNLGFRMGGGKTLKTSHCGACKWSKVRVELIIGSSWGCFFKIWVSGSGGLYIIFRSWFWVGIL